MGEQDPFEETQKTLNGNEELLNLFNSKDNLESTLKSE